jgi:hypothetical protein
MADDLEYSGPLNTYGSAEALLPPLMRFAAMVAGARMIELVVEGDWAALLYDCELSIAGGASEPPTPDSPRPSPLGMGAERAPPAR